MKKSLKTLAIDYVLNQGNQASYSQIINYLISLRSDIPAGTDIIIKIKNIVDGILYV